MCGTNDEESYMDNLMTTAFDVDTEVDLDRDMPGFEGTMDALEDMVDGVVGEPEFLGADNMFGLNETRYGSKDLIAGM